MASHEQAVELLNSAKLSSDGDSKVGCLKGLLELVVRKDPHLLPEFLPDVLELQVEPVPAVKKFLPDFVDGAVQVQPTPDVLQQCLSCLRALAGEGSAGIARRALQSCYPAFRTAYAVVALRGSDAQQQAALVALWDAAQDLKAGVAAVTGQPGNEGVRLAAAKFVEQAVMLLTAETVPAVTGVSIAAHPLPPGNLVVTKTALVKAAEQLLAQLLALLKVKPGSETPPPLLAAAIRAAGGIAQQRPQFMGKLLPPLLALASSLAAQPEAQGQHTGAPTSAVTSSLQAALQVVMRSQHPLARTWQKRVSEALSAMAPEQRPQADRQAKQLGWPMKRAKLEDADVVASQHQAANLHSQQQLDSDRPLAAAQLAAAPAAAAEGPAAVQHPPTSPADLQQVQTVLQALVRGQDANTLAAFLTGLQPAVLADAVLAYLVHLPPAELLPPDSVPVEPWVLQLMQLVATQHALPAAGTAVQPQEVHTPLEPSAAGQQQRLPSQPLAGQQVPGAIAKPADVPTAAVKPAAPRLPVVTPSLQLEPIPLTDQQQLQLRQEAVLRIMQAERLPAPQLRVALAGRLAAAASGQGDPVGDAVLKQLLKDFKANRGLGIALQWLHVLFLQQCKPFGATMEVTIEQDSKGVGDAGQLEVTGSGEQQPYAQQSPRWEGTPYERVLLALLHGLREALPPTDRTLISLLLEAPVLPMPAVARFLEELCSSGLDWATLALLAARDLVLQRPPSRAPVLAFALEVASYADAEARGKAVRLLANRLFPETSLSARIQQEATQLLDSLVASPPAASADAVAAAPPVPVGDAEQPAEEAAAAANEEPEDVPAEPVQPGPSEQEAGQRCALYCALCTKKHSLLQHLFEVYGQTSDGGRAAIHRNAAGLAKTLGPTAPALLAVVQDPPPGSLPLVLQMVYVLAEGGVPPQALVTACLQLFSSSGDARVLPPVLPGMDRAAALRLLGPLLDLPPEALKGALQRLVTPLAGPAGEQLPALFSAAEVLAALHTLDTARDPALLRKMMQGITVCLSSSSLFPPEALAATINQLLTRVSLPQLFMRTVIQTLAAAPKLRSFVVSIMRQLVGKQVWKDSTQWKGWLMCAQQTAPDSFTAVLQLPTTVLGQALAALPLALKQQLAAHAQQTGGVPQSSLALLTDAAAPQP